MPGTRFKVAGSNGHAATSSCSAMPCGAVPRGWSVGLQPSVPDSVPRVRGLCGFPEESCGSAAPFVTGSVRRAARRFRPAAAVLAVSRRTAGSDRLVATRRLRSVQRILQRFGPPRSATFFLCRCRSGGSSGIGVRYQATHKRLVGGSNSSRPIGVFGAIFAEKRLFHCAAGARTGRNKGRRRVEPRLLSGLVLMDKSSVDSDGSCPPTRCSLRHRSADRSNRAGPAA